MPTLLTWVFDGGDADPDASPRMQERAIVTAVTAVTAVSTAPESGVRTGVSTASESGVRTCQRLLEKVLEQSVLTACQR